MNSSNAPAGKTTGYTFFCDHVVLGPPLPLQIQVEVRTGSLPIIKSDQ